MNTTYLVLLRGINVGGKNMIKMAALKDALVKAGFESVTTYIQSGNVILSSSNQSADKVAAQVEAIILADFGIPVSVAVVTRQEWDDILRQAPKAWGKDPAWKHNILVLLKPYDMPSVIEAIGTLKPDIEMLVAGNGVLYQSMSRELFGKTTTGKLASSPVYKRMTVRNYNTAVALHKLMV